MPYSAADDRYDVQPYRRCGRSGLLLPAVSLGFWHNFGDDKPLETQRAIMRRAFDLGVTHFDLANNYGPPYGSAESNVGRILAEDFAGYRDELVISTKAGWDMWPGPYGDLGSRKYLTASLDQSLRRLGSTTSTSSTTTARTPTRRWRRRWARWTPSSGPARRSTSASRPTPASTRLGPPPSCATSGTPLVIHQPSYSMFNRWIETDLLDVLDAEGVGCIAFTALAQGLLTDRYLDGIPADSRAAAGQVAVHADDQRRQPRPDPGAERDRRRDAARPWRSWPWPGCCAIHHDLDADRREQRAAARGQRRRRGEARLHRRRAGRHRRARGRVRGRPVGRSAGVHDGVKLHLS